MLVVSTELHAVQDTYEYSKTCENGHSKRDQKVLMTTGSLMNVESIANQFMFLFVESGRLTHVVSFLFVCLWGRSGSVVECLTRDRGAAGSSPTGVTVLCP